ncbi:MAG TPA: M61 family peptidase, partial [Granulicella sp.]|nr:M61 family peptidase [Granulicella sp.]
MAKLLRRSTLLLSALLPVGAFAQAASPITSANPIQITADLSEGPRHLFHAEVEIPVKPGPLTLITPKWIPGNHRPTGPVDDITGVVFTADGPGGVKTVLPWRRDNEDLYEFHLTVPAGVTTLHAHLDTIAPARVTTKMAVLEWEKLLLYPANIPTREIAIQPSLTVPAGWGTGTALQPIGPVAAPANTGVDERDHTAAASTVTTKYAVTTVEQLEDSPVITGQYFHEFPLAPEIKPAHYLDVVSDEPDDSNIRPETLAEVSNLVREAD